MEIISLISINCPTVKTALPARLDLNPKHIALTGGGSYSCFRRGSRLLNKRKRPTTLMHCLGILVAGLANSRSYSRCLVIMARAVCKQFYRRNGWWKCNIRLGDHQRTEMLICRDGWCIQTWESKGGCWTGCISCKRGLVVGGAGAGGSRGSVGSVLKL